MSGWPIHEYDDWPDRRRLRRSLLVLGERLTRAMRLYEIVEWLNRRLTR